MSTVRDRLEREARDRAEAAKCPPHPYRALFWRPGDAMTPDALICGRCFVTLDRRPHLPGRARRPHA